MSAASREHVRAVIAAAIGADRARDPRDPDDRVDDLLPAAVARPASAAEVAALLAAAARESIAVIPSAGGTKRSFGAAPERADLLLDLTALAAVKDWSPRDGVLVVEPAVAVASAEAHVRADSRTLANDWPNPARGTLGGAAAVGRMPIDRLGPAGPRWSVIGMKVAHCDGTLANHGARVAKNVAGLDLPRLHVGALGTLGVIVELTVRTRPSATVAEAITANADAPAEVEARVPPQHLDALVGAIAPRTGRPEALAWMRVEPATGAAQLGFHAGRGDSPALDGFRDWLARARAAARSFGGYLLVTRAPAAWKRAIDVWGEPPAAIALMRKLKQLYDPERILNPGRFVGGI